MKLITEVNHEKSEILIIAKKNEEFVQILKKKLKEYNSDIFISPQIFNNSKSFSYIFLINEFKMSYLDLLKKNQKVIFIFLNDLKKAEKIADEKKNKNIKIVNIEGNFKSEHIDKILWFFFSQTEENFLRLFAPKKHVPFNNKISRNLLTYYFSILKKNFIAIIIILLIILHIAFIIPLGLSGLLIYFSLSNATKDEFISSKYLIESGNMAFLLADKLYSIVRPTYLIFSLALPVDDVYEIERRSIHLINLTLDTQTNLSSSLELFTKQNKSSDELNDLILKIKKLNQVISDMDSDLTIIRQKIPVQYSIFRNYKEKLDTYSDFLSKLAKIVPYYDQLIGKGKHEYLLLFANDKELRPGGGFIGSFGIISIKDYTFEGIRLYDVYDADGQLIAHVEPPAPIRKYLNQPNWFLRDSAFSPDFLDNYVQAKYFLEKEMKLTDFSGAVLFTTTSIENILDSFGDVYIPDFKETINKKNFYIKAQIYSEQNFFPGSTKKKNFLGSIARQIILNLQNASLNKISFAVKKSLDEKQIAAVSENPEIQKILDSFFWSGRLIQQSCPENIESCYPDYIFPIEANLGVNKANFFVTKNMDLKITIDDNGNVKHLFSVQFKNDSIEGVFPGGIYKNYFQLYLPLDSKIDSITKDGNLIENYDTLDEDYKKIGLYLEIKPGSITDLRIVYNSNKLVSKGRTNYQLIIQKQLGTANSDFTLRFNLAKNIHILNQNFSALVINDEILYNSSLSADKIFFVQLTKE